MPQGIEEPNYIKKRRDAEDHKRERQHHQDNMQIIGALNRIGDELAATEEQEKIEDNNRTSREKLTIILLFLTVIFTGMADIIFFRTMNDARKASNQQHADTLLALTKTDASVAILKTQGKTMRHQLDEMREEQRAWVGATSGSNLTLGTHV